VTLIDVIQLSSLIVSLFAIGAWSIKLRRWPLTIAVLIAMLVNVAFYFARTLNWLVPTELNLFSAVRVLLLCVVIAAIPFSLEHK
jgi:hypothetical protein